MTRGLFVLVCALAVIPDLMAQTHRQPERGFTAEVDVLAPQPSNQSMRQPHILCGMRVFPTDPTIDPRMTKPTPPGTFTLGVAQPQTCRESFVSITPSPFDLKQRLPQILGPKR